MPKAPETPKVKIDAKAAAKLEASAKVSISRNKNVTEVIPPDVTRAKSRAWLDIVSPLSEWAGLKGDQLRYKREHFVFSKN